MIGKKILVVEDDNDIQRIIEKTFRNIGATVDFASTVPKGFGNSFWTNPTS